MARLTIKDLKHLSPDARKQIRRALRSQAGVQAPLTALSTPEEAPSKYRNVRTTVDGIAFASRREANRYAELKMEQQAGEITDLRRQIPFSLDVNGIHICDYEADFVYTREHKQIVEDAKGKRLELFRLKKALMLAIHGIVVVEV